MEIEVKCPSGLKGVIRGWKTKEANILSNRRNTRDGTAFDKVLAGCWLSTADSGIYTFKDSSKPDWGKVLVCDRFWALLCMRVATYGDPYEFSVQCQDRSFCGKRIEWECNLMDLPFKELPDESKAKIAEGDNSFEVEVNGTTFNFHLVTGEGERKAGKLTAGQDTRLVVAALATRIDSIEGVEKGGLVRYLDDLDLGDLMALLDTFDSVDGGVDTTIEIECPHCGLLQDVDLPFDRDFFLPRSKRKKSGSTLLESL